MKFKVSNILLLFIVTFLMSGCVKWKNGVQVPSEDEVKRNQIHTVFIDNSEVIKQENKMMVDFKTMLNEGVNIPYKILDVKGFDSNHKLVKSDLFFHLKSKDVSLAYSGLSKPSLMYVHKFFKQIYEPSFIKMKFDIVDRKLVAKKKYNNASEIYNDAIKISAIKNDPRNVDLYKNYGFNDFILDTNEFVNNKLVLIPITNFFSLKNKAKSHLETMKFKVTEDKTRATDIINLEILAFTTTNNIKDIKKKSSLVSNYYDTSVANSAMNASKLSGSSSSTAAGVGAGLILLDLLSSPDKDKQYVIAPILSKEKNGKTIILKPKALSFPNMNSINFYYKKHINKKSDHSYQTFSSSLSHFIKRDTGINTYDRIISK